MTVELVWDGKQKIFCIPYISYAALYSYHEIFPGKKEALKIDDIHIHDKIFKELK